MFKGDSGGPIACRGSSKQWILQTIVHTGQHGSNCLEYEAPLFSFKIASAHSFIASVRRKYS